MTVGDPRKALVLGAIAVVVVGMAVMRALPQAPAPVAARPADAVQSEAPPNLEDDISASVSVDPFSHPDLEKAVTPPKVEKPKIKPTPKPEFDLKIEHTRPGSDSEFEPLPAVKSNGTSIDLSAGIPFRVEAVVRGDEAFALVTLANSSGIAVRVGTTLNGHVKIAEIKSGSVVIEASGKRIEVTVGEGVTL
ncbi:MAG: hypothetical protein IT363_08075 [Methanoregulaceae archaeon]|nr:hypothetical protein [Methanoregulaceae archaeon]